MNNKNTENKFKHPDFEQYPVFNNKNIEKLRSLAGDQTEVLKEIVNSFLEESSFLLKNIEDAIDKSQFEKLRENVHSIKGLFATIGATKLFEISKYMDENIKKDNFELTSKLFPMLKSNCSEFEKIIKNKFL